MTPPLIFTDPLFGQAVATIDAGDLAILRDLLTTHPHLLTARAAGDALFSGYFAEPTLLHFVAENPIRNGTLPDNIADVAQLLIDSGIPADIPSSDGGTTLGLVCSGMVARQAGVVPALVQVLMQNGADPEKARLAALGHAELPALRALLANGMTLDLQTAASLNQTDQLPALHQAYPDQLQAALLFACQAGQYEAVRALLEMGADLNGRSPSVRGGGVTPLHLAVMAEHLPILHLLLREGADVTQKDSQFGGTPLEWAQHMGKQAALLVFGRFGHDVA